MSEGLASSAAMPFPLPLDAYTGEEGMTLAQVLLHRAEADPFNLVATALFLLAILHTFAAARITSAAHRLQHRIEREGGGGGHSFRVEMLHFLGEVEAIFGIWAVPLVLSAVALKGWRPVEQYVANVHFTEPMFVVVIMAIASTRPVLSFAERCMGALASLGGGTPFAWWATILTVGPLLGSLITEPAAMTICALLLARHLYELDPSPGLKYGTLGLLFVNVSVGGTLTHFAAPPVLMVAGKYGWGLTFMLRSFGWKAALAILVATAVYAALFRKEFALLAGRKGARLSDPPEGP